MTAYLARYAVRVFTRSHQGELNAGEWIEAPSAAAARTLAVRLALSAGGAIAVSIGDAIEEIARYGATPPDFPPAPLSRVSPQYI
jgi:hypothetical protein